MREVEISATEGIQNFLNQWLLKKNPLHFSVHASAVNTSERGGGGWKGGHQSFSAFTKTWTESHMSP